MASKAIKWETKPELLEWKSIATEKQRFYYEFFKNRRWEIYEEPEQPYLKSKIGYALFGPPINVKDTSISIDNFYSPAQKKRIEDIFYAMKKVNKGVKNVIVGFIFFIGTIENRYTEFPIFRVLKKKQEDGSETCNFVDSFGYVYKNWEKFLHTNIIPNCIYCYPKDGFYSCNESGDLELGFGYCPQSPILSGIVWAVGTVGSAVGSVGSAVGTVLPGGRTAQSELLPIPLISAIKGIRGRNKFTWIPVTSASGSADLYAVHFTQALAESSQTTQTIPAIIYDTLEKGFINITWYAIINHISSIVRNSNKTTNMHVAQVISSALFFCHSVPSSVLTKIIIKEIRSDKSNKTLNNLEHCKKIALENSLESKEKTSCNPVIKGLKFVDDRAGLINEIIETTFQTHFMISDESGNYYTLGTLLKNIETSIESKKYADIITNYCLMLENTIWNCKNCSQIMESQGKFIGTLCKKFNTVKDRETYKKQIGIDEKEMVCIKNEINKCDNLTSIQEKKLELNITNDMHKDIPKDNINTPDKLKIIDKVAGNSWLLINVFNTLASPLVTPPQKQQEANEKGEGFAEKEITVFTSTQDTPKSAKVAVGNSGRSNEETPTKEKSKSIQEEVSRNTIIQEFNADSKDICIPDKTSLLDVYEALKKNLKDCTQNINTPDIKIYNKTVKCASTNKKGEPNVLNICAAEQAANTSCSANELHISEKELNNISKMGNTKNDIVPDSKLSSMLSNNEDETTNKYCTKSNSGEQSEKSLPQNKCLSGKHFTVTREYIPEKELAPLAYFKLYVRPELNNTKPLHYTTENGNKGWQFVMPEEVLCVKVVKIIITERSTTEKKELVTISYY